MLTTRGSVAGIAFVLLVTGGCGDEGTDARSSDEAAQADTQSPEARPDPGSDRATAPGRIALDGTGLQRITNDPAEERLPAWSPDGASIVFASDRDGNEEIYVASPDGTGLVNLTTDPVDDFAPDWGSPL